MSGEIVRKCKCGRAYTHEQWLAMPMAPDWDMGEDFLEQRHCACGSHIVRIVGLETKHLPPEQRRYEEYPYADGR